MTSKFFEGLKEMEVDKNLLHRVVVAEQANARQGTQCAKTRSEVAGGGKKPYKQKKTGNARQGTIRAPHYAHGSMALAVKPRSYEKKVNRKERRLALVTAFAARMQAGDIVVVDAVKFAEPRTKQATAMLAAAGLGEARRVLVVLAEHDENTFKCFRNLPNVVVKTAPNREGRGEAFSTRDLVVAHKVLIDGAGMAAFERAYSAEGGGE